MGERMNDLMTLADIAEMNHCGLRHARDVLVKLPGFPAEAPTSTPRNRLGCALKCERSFIGNPHESRTSGCGPHK
jgi:hypothetical protein